MKKRNLSFVSFILIPIIICLSFQIPSFATDINDLYVQREDVKTDLENATSQMQGIQSELTATLQQIQELSTTIEKYEGEIEELNTKIDEFVTNIDELQVNLEIAEKDYEEQRKLLEDRLVVLYKSGETTYLDFILTSKSLTEFISNFFLVNEIVAYDTQLLNSINTQKREIETNKKKLEEQKKEFNTIRANVTKKAVILKNTTTLKNDYISRLTDEEKIVQEKIDLYEAEVNLIEQEIASLLTNIDSAYVGGIMAWPVPGYTRITSPYGMRIHPITGVYKLHTGLDISAPIGTNFIAVNDGIVIKAGWGGAYGNMVMIDHGGGVTTLYAHGSEIVVELGQQVEKGDPVLKVGSTGYSTGPHAHFEVRINNVPQEPLPYITTQKTGE